MKKRTGINRWIAKDYFVIGLFELGKLSLVGYTWEGVFWKPIGHAL